MSVYLTIHVGIVVMFTLLFWGFRQSLIFDKIKNIMDEWDVLTGEDVVKFKSSTLHIVGEEYLFKMEPYSFYQDFKE